MEIAFQSDVGRRRNTNQDFADSFVNQGDVTLVALADGMGGHRAGDIASQQAVEILGKSWINTDLDVSEKATQWFIQTIQKANVEIFEKGQENTDYSGMGTTLVAAILEPDQFTIANVGDSRGYLVQKNGLKQLTEDHSLVNELVKSGEITEEQAVNHPRKNILTRSVGIPGLLEVDVANHYWEANDYLLLCSDGLTNMISEAEILAIITSEHTLTEKTTELIHRANEAGGADNITVLLVANRGGQL